ncbi:MAG: phospholipase D-like domain-containing protein [Deferrisomatales bacterium]|nr:phospholipase D-like domain-containing protein [Deferrisomatales bacterium]
MERALLNGLEPMLAAWPYLLAALYSVVSLTASGHAVLHKRDTRAAIGWAGLIWLTPILGTLLYVWLGINRIERRARTLRTRRPASGPPTGLCECSAEVLENALTAQGIHLVSLVRLVGNVTRGPLVAGNRITPLVNGGQAYPAMLSAIDEASRSVTLTTYIFENDRAGRRFLEALQGAMARGVEVRLLLDDVGARYSWRPVPRLLREAGIPVATFLPTRIPWRFQYSNLRSHRKILVADGVVGFTGGMNIYEGNCLELEPGHPVQDLHFRLTGPVVAQLQAAFAEDWAFCTGEPLQGAPWFGELEPAGPVLARGIADGPDDDFEKLRLAILGAIACARASILVVTPYFLPDASVITALNVAALRGVAVDIVLPEENDLRLVKWASTALLGQVLERGCRVWSSPAPFDHTKLMLVDGVWTLLGSANWDPRSLRLNFEFNVECYDRELTTTLTEHVQGKIRQSRPVSLADVEGRSLPVKLRDGVARLCSPYL